MNERNKVEYESPSACLLELMSERTICVSARVEAVTQNYEWNTPEEW